MSNIGKSVWRPMFDLRHISGYAVYYDNNDKALHQAQGQIVSYNGLAGVIEREANDYARNCS